MRYHYTKPDVTVPVFGQLYICNHPVYDRCTLFLIEKKGLAIIQQRYDQNTKHTWWTEIDPDLANAIYTHAGFKDYFDKKASESVNDIYPTVTVRQIMWALKMKPIKRQPWETCFDYTPI